MADFLERVLRATGFDYCDDIWWRGERGRGQDEDDPLVIYVQCNDVFAWACADCERITPENVAVLEASIRDCEALGDQLSGPTLFCARVRGLRPQGAVLKEIDNPAILALFDAVGEKRPIDFGNPYAHPQDGGKYAYEKPQS